MKEILSPRTPLSSLPRLGETEQRDTAVLAGHPEWLQSVLDAAPPAVQSRIRWDVEADTELAAISQRRGTSFPPWRILEPQPASTLLGYYRSAESRTKVPWNVLAAIHLIESRTGRIRGPSSAGAQGPMQFIPSTWAIYGEGGDIWSDRDSIQAAARLLASNGAPGDLAGAIYRYNNSEHYVKAVLSYASAMAADPRSYYAYYGWQVYVATTSGTYLLPVGYRGPGSG
jgi:membrane-bound lytic murein transglycosylase B